MWTDLLTIHGFSGDQDTKPLKGEDVSMGVFVSGLITNNKNGSQTNCWPTVVLVVFAMPLTMTERLQTCWPIAASVVIVTPK
mmetsp:Transcript_653/g.1990  ORF Transcript_653/g.1990 Transcript_653/m.1990 type:complete len:82 (+) Transcript_653:1733-1978(+)